MNTKILKLFLALFLCVFWISCEDPDETNTNDENANSDPESSTIGQDLNGASDPIGAVFFDLTDESLNYTYDFYSVSGIGYANTIDLPCSIRETDVVNLYTFPEYLIEAQNCQYENCGWCNGSGLDSSLNQEDCVAAGGSWIESPNELDDAKKINAKCILNNNKALNISQLAALIKDSVFVVANDTGPAHIAAHLNVNGISLFGSHTTAHKVSIERENFKAIQVSDLSKLSAEKVFEKICNLIS